MATYLPFCLGGVATNLPIHWGVAIWEGIVIYLPLPAHLGEVGNLSAHSFGRGGQLICLKGNDYLPFHLKGNGHLPIFLGRDGHQSIHSFG